MIRLAGDGDREVVRAVDRECFGADAWSEQSWDVEIDAKNVTIAVAGDAVQGVCVMRAVGDEAEIFRVGVPLAYRGRGIARALLTTALDTAGERRCTRMFLEVESDNQAALALYRSCGFATLSQRRNYYGSGRDALVMSRDVVTDG